MSNRPGGKLAKRPLQFIWIIDCSGSMLGKKIETVNFAIRECIPEMKNVAHENPNAEVQVRALAFSSGVRWCVAQPTDIESFKWTDLTVGGVTDMGAAMKEIAKELDVARMPERGLPPVLVLLSDGQPTDDFNTGLKKLMEMPWAVKSVRISVAIGDDCDMAVLERFSGNPELVLKADSAPQLVKMIKWASTVPLKAASNPATRTSNDQEATNVQVDGPDEDIVKAEVGDVW